MIFSLLPSAQVRRLRRSFRVASGATLALLAALITANAGANAMYLSTNGTGQVLLFPYYTARGGTVSLMSLVNTTTQAKAVRVNVREARGGFVVAQFNVYLSAKDVWTAAIVADSDGAQLVTNDKSCTAPAIGTRLAFSADAYGADALSLRTRDRTREGYIEVIEMAAIPNATSTGVSVTHIIGIPTCKRLSADVTDVAYEPPAADLIAPTGGLMGSPSMVNVAKGMLASASPTVIENFWLTGPDAPAPRVVAANSSAMDLTSGKNTSIAFTAADIAFVHLTRQPYAFTAKFANSIDAATGLLLGAAMHSEYAYTNDQVLGTLMIATFPTKAYYVFVPELNPPPIRPFASVWDPAKAQSCDPMGVAPYDRDEATSSTPDDFPERPPQTFVGTCFAANPIRIGGIDVTASVSSPLEQSLALIQNGGLSVKTPGKEGGWAEISWTSAVARITPTEAAIYTRNSSGVLAWQPTKIVIQGLPVIGFTLSQAAYQTGSPQQNYADAVPLRTLRFVSLQSP